MGKNPPAFNNLLDVKPNKKPPRATANKPQMIKRCIHQCTRLAQFGSLGVRVVARPRTTKSIVQPMHRMTKTSAKFECTKKPYLPSAWACGGPITKNQMNRGTINQWMIFRYNRLLRVIPELAPFYCFHNGYEDLTAKVSRPHLTPTGGPETSSGYESR